jgi:hypothetical protein
MRNFLSLKILAIGRLERARERETLREKRERRREERWMDVVVRRRWMDGCFSSSYILNLGTFKIFLRVTIKILPKSLGSYFVYI